MSLDDSSRVSDAILLQQVEQGSSRAFNTLFERYWQQSYSIAYKRLKNHSDAKDIVQEIFTQIWINRQTTHIENLPAYLNVAIRNRVIKFVLNQQSTHPFFNLLDNISEKNSNANAPLLWKEFLKTYEALLETLPAKRQTIFRLHYQENLSTKAIGIQMGITRKTVQNQLGKAIKTIKVSLIHIITFALLLLTDLF